MAGIPDFAGYCTPFVYLGFCPMDLQKVHMINARVWMIATIVGEVCMLIALARRLYCVQEPLNTFWLLALKWISSPPFLIAYDAIRAFDPKGFGLHPAVAGLVWVLGWLPLLLGLLLMVCTWMAFSEQSLMTRPPLTGNRKLYYALGIPTVLLSLAGSFPSGFGFKWYNVVVRLTGVSWCALCIGLLIAAVYFGRQVISMLKKTDPKAAKHTQKVYFLVIQFLAMAAITTGIQVGLLRVIDGSIFWFLFFNVFQRFMAFMFFMGGAAYCWVMTNRIMKASAGMSGSCQMGSGSPTV